MPSIAKADHSQLLERQIGCPLRIEISGIDRRNSDNGRLSNSEALAEGFDYVHPAALVLNSTPNVVRMAGHRVESTRFDRPRIPETALADR